MKKDAKTFGFIAGAVVLGMVVWEFVSPTLLGLLGHTGTKK